jgi:RNA polymerase sigma factor (sigma-70 family)
MSETAEQSCRFAPLMRAAQDGDRTAYRDLLVAVTPMIRRGLKRRYPFLAVEVLEDLTQDVLLAVHGARATYDPERPFVPWLMAILRNRAADAARRYVRGAAFEVPVDEYPETFEAADTNMSDETYRDGQVLRQEIERLPEGQRVAIELLKLKEMSLKEAAAVSGMSVGALKIATHRATKALRVALKARHPVGY